MNTVRRMIGATLVAVSSLPVLLALAGPASAAECSGGVSGLLGSCNQPSSSPQPAPSSDPQPAPSQPAPSQPAPQPAGTIAEKAGAAARILDLVNRDRASAGLAALVSRSQITSIAQGHSTAMAGRRTIWHNDAYFTASTRRSLNARALAENVAMNGSVDDAHRRLMASPGHRANILNGSFDAIGISVVHDERGMFYVTENFVDSLEAAAAAAPAPAKAVAQPRRAVAPAVASAPKPVTAAPAPAAPAADAPQPAAPAELDQADQAGAEPASTDGTPSTTPIYGAIATAITALLGALAAMVRFG